MHFLCILSQFKQSQKNNCRDVAVTRDTSHNQKSRVYSLQPIKDDHVPPLNCVNLDIAFTYRVFYLERSQIIMISWANLSISLNIFLLNPKSLKISILQKNVFFFEIWQKHVT
jgi:hypothetical protein